MQLQITGLKFLQLQFHILSSLCNVDKTGGLTSPFVKGFLSANFGSTVFGLAAFDNLLVGAAAGFCDVLFKAGFDEVLFKAGLGLGLGDVVFGEGLAFGLALVVGVLAADVRRVVFGAAVELLVAEAFFKELSFFLSSGFIGGVNLLLIYYKTTSWLN